MTPKFRHMAKLDKGGLIILIVGTPKEPLKCLECEGPHVWRNCPLLTESNKTVHNLQEASIVGEIGKSFHRINVVLEDRQEDHQYAIVEIEGTMSLTKSSLY